MNLHLVKVKCTILTTDFNGESVAKKKNLTLVLRNAETFGNAENETARYFGEKASPENLFSINSVSKAHVDDVLLDPESDEPNWYKLKASVSFNDSDKPITIVNLIQAESMEKAQKRFSSKYESLGALVSFKTSTEMAIIDYVELASTEEETAFGVNAQSVSAVDEGVDFDDEPDDFESEEVDDSHEESEEEDF